MVCRFLNIVFFATLFVTLALPVSAEQSRDGVLELQWEPSNGWSNANVILVHGIRTDKDVWNNWIDWCRKDSSGRALWTFDYNWGDFAGDAAWNLKEEIKKHRGHFEGKPLTLIGHSKGGLVVKAFAYRLTTSSTGTGRNDNFEDSELQNLIKLTEFRVLYLDTPHRGSPILADPNTRKLVWHDLGPHGGNLDVAKELGEGFTLEPNGVTSSNIVPPKHLSDVDVRVNPAKTSPVVPFHSGSNGGSAVVLKEKDLAPYRKPGVGYKGWHNSVARCRAMYEDIFVVPTPLEWVAIPDRTSRGRRWRDNNTYQNGGKNFAETYEKIGLSPSQLQSAKTATALAVIRDGRELFRVQKRDFEFEDNCLVVLSWWRLFDDDLLFFVQSNHKFNAKADFPKGLKWASRKHFIPLSSSQVAKLKKIVESSKDKSLSIHKHNFGPGFFSIETGGVRFRETPFVIRPEFVIKLIERN